MRAPSIGWAGPRTLGELLDVAVGARRLRPHELRHRNPLAPLSIFRIKGLGFSNVTRLTAFAGFLGLSFSLTLCIREVLSYSLTDQGGPRQPAAVHGDRRVGRDLIPAPVSYRDPAGDHRRCRHRRRRAVLAIPPERGGVDLAKVVDSPMGRRPIGEGVSFPASDLFVHAWDLARSVGNEVEVPAAVTDFAHAVIEPLPEAAVRSDQVFAAPVSARPDGSPSQEFIAWTGRNPSWSPGSGR